MSGPSLNRVELIGRLTRDPELRQTQSGQSMCSFGLATSRYVGDGNGDGKDVPEFHSVVVWNNGAHKLADHVHTYVRKGALVYVEGRIQTRSWEGANGKAHVTEIVATNVQFLERVASRERLASAGGN